jgi:hypothetical protein
MQITKDILISRRKEIEGQLENAKSALEQAKSTVSACNGAIQMLDILIQTAEAPEMPKQG